MEEMSEYIDHEESDEEDFLTKSLRLYDHTGSENAASIERRGKNKSLYNGKKPKWWRQQSLKPNKKLKKIIRDMQDTFCIQSPPYGELLQWDSVFANAREIWIEIGFGLGDNLLCLAQKFPERCYLGSEVHKSGVGTILQRLQGALQSGKHWTGYTPYEQEKQQEAPINTDAQSSPATDSTTLSLCNNVRIYRSDITKLLPFVSDKTVHSILVTFPDPFPGGEQWRLLQADVIAQLHRVLMDGGRLYLATDHTGHFEWCMSQMAIFNETELGFLRVEPTPDRNTWLPVVSKYERKGWDEGRGTLLACWEVTSSATDKSKDSVTR